MSQTTAVEHFHLMTKPWRADAFSTGLDWVRFGVPNHCRDRLLVHSTFDSAIWASPRPGRTGGASRQNTLPQLCISCSYSTGSSLTVWHNADMIYVTSSTV